MSFLFSAFIFLSVAAFVYATPLNPTPVPLPQVASPQQQQNHQWHYPQISGPEATIMVGFLAAIIAVIGWVVVHRTALTRDREARDHADRKEKEARRSELLSTLKHWENTFVIVTDPTKLGTLYYEGGGMRALAEAAEKFRGYVTDKDTFDRLNHQMSAMNPQALDAHGNDQRRETICGAIRAFYDFSRNA